MASHTPFAGLTPDQLRQHLAVIDIDPAEMFGLGLVYFADPDAVDVMCEHAKMSFRLLIGLYAASAHLPGRPVTSIADARIHDWFRDQVSSCVVDQVRSATETDLLEGLDTARALFDAGRARTFQNDLFTISAFFAEYALEEALTDRVVAEMSLSFTDLLSPGQAHVHPSSRRTCPSQYISRFLLSKFGKHAPSWDMFKQIHTPDVRIGDVVDLVVVLAAVGLAAASRRAWFGFDGSRTAGCSRLRNRIFHKQIL